jgi:hypothetical protein
MFKKKKIDKKDIMKVKDDDKEQTKEQSSGTDKERTREETIEELQQRIDNLKKMPEPPEPMEEPKELPEFYTANEVMQGLKEFYQEFKKDIGILSQNQVILNTTMLKILGEYEQYLEEPKEKPEKKKK